MQGKIVVITGASRGIGRAMALRFAKEKAQIVLLAKTIEPHAKLPGTLLEVAEQVNKLGGKAWPIQLDVRDQNAIVAVAQQVMEKLGCVHVLINNAGAIRLTDTENTPAKSFDLMHQVNVRATFLMSQSFLPLLKEAHGAHIINLSPPISLEARWLSPHLAYTLSKYGMSMCTLGMAEEFRKWDIAVNSLWPKTIIYTAAIDFLLGEAAKDNARKPEIVAEAAFIMANQSPKDFTGQLLLDETVLKQFSALDLAPYQYMAGANLMPDLYIDN